MWNKDILTVGGNVKFNYVDFMSSSDKKLIKKLYYESFDKEERFPFWLLKKCSKEKECKI